MYAEETATLSTELIELEERYGAHNYFPLDVIIERAEGSWVYDVEGKRYLDFLAAYSAVNQGHCHPAILGAMCRQAEACWPSWLSPPRPVEGFQPSRPVLRLPAARQDYHTAPENRPFCRKKDEPRPRARR